MLKHYDLSSRRNGKDAFGGRLQTSEHSTCSHPLFESSQFYLKGCSQHKVKQNEK